MYAIILENRDRTITHLVTCRSKEAALIASQLEKDKVSPADRSRIRAVALDDGGYTEITF